MAGEGFVFNMISSLKNNNALRKKKDYFYLKKEYLDSAKRKSLNVKKATPTQLAEIRQDIIASNRRAFYKKLVALFIAIVVTTLFLFIATDAIKSMFINSRYSVPEPIENKL
jgi:hypothetical protein